MIDVDIDNFDPYNIQLPMAAESLANEAVSTALSILGSDNKQAVTLECRKIVNELVTHTEKISPGLVENYPVDHSNIFNFPTDPEIIDKIKDDFHVSDSNNSDFAKRINEDDSVDQQMKYFSVLLLFQVYLIKLSEDHALETSNSNYQYVMKELDPLINDLHGLITLVSSFIPGMDYIAIKASRIIGASKGGKARNQRFSELKELVIEKDSSLHQEKTAAASARAIHAELDEQAWLLDEKGEQLLVDPVFRLTDWIRAARKERKVTPA